MYTLVNKTFTDIRQCELANNMHLLLQNTVNQITSPLHWCFHRSEIIQLSLISLRQILLEPKCSCNSIYLEVYAPTPVPHNILLRDLRTDDPPNVASGRIFSNKPYLYTSVESHTRQIIMSTINLILECSPEGGIIISTKQNQFFFFFSIIIVQGVGYFFR